ncbi:hypothetical protein K492DRAFT_231529 [Lichtheimia hyalospora FSU 10163]|nr:hypothetical protein K492DRAFT_231529 [Lichtheimia hyalospora FSU 10163]
MRLWSASRAHHNQTPLLALPKELLLKIISNVALYDAYPSSLIQLSITCRHLYYLIHKDPWRQATLWPRAFSARFDTSAIYRRQLYRQLDWQAALERRCRALETCRQVAAKAATQQPQDLVDQLSNIDWEIIWDMITEHDELNIPQLLNHQVHLLAGAAFQLGSLRDREAYPVVLPILSLLVNYDFTISRFFTSDISPHIVSHELSQFAYDFEADALITKHMSPRLFHSQITLHEDDDQFMNDSKNMMDTTVFYPSQDPLTAAFHLFFTTIFACHPAPYEAIPKCSPIPLFPIRSDMFDVEFLRRYERQLFHASLRESRDKWYDKHYKTPASTIDNQALENIYSDTGFASSTHFVSEAHLIEGEWMGYYSFLDVDEDDDGNDIATAASDWFDGPMRLTLRIVPLDDEEEEQVQSSMVSRPTGFPSCHLRTCPLTRFEGIGADNVGGFHVTGLIDDSEDGQVTWEKTYIDSGETWEYAGRFLLPMGLCGRWGDEQYGGPWWMWKVQPSIPSTSGLDKSSSS